MITYVTISSSQTLQDSPQISYAVFGLLPGKVFTGLFLPCLDLQTFPSPHIWQLFSVYNFFYVCPREFLCTGSFYQLFFYNFVCNGQFQFQQISLGFYNRLVCATSGWASRKHSPSSSSVIFGVCICIPDICHFFSTGTIFG